MEKLEKHLLHEYINGTNIDLTEQQLMQLSLEFHKQYNLLNKMKTQNLPINKINLEVYAISQDQKINIDYAVHNEEFAKQNLNDLINFQINIIEKNDRFDQYARLLNDFREGKQSSGLELYKSLSTNLGSSNIKMVNISKYYEEQTEFFRNILNGVELDGLVLYGNEKKNSKQFMQLSYLLKRILLTDLVIIGARPSVGKTSFALALMNALYKNEYKPMFVSLEMSNGELLQRMATSKAGLSHDKLMSPNASNQESKYKLTQEEIALYESSLKEVSEMQIGLIDDENVPQSWFDIKKILIDNLDKFDYVIIDHLHIIGSYDGNPNNDKNNMIADITRDMKQFARQYKKPVIALAQLSREVRSGGRKEDPSYIVPNMTDLRASGSIEQDADKIIMLHRQNSSAMKEHIKYGSFPIGVKLEKNRAGALGTVNMRFNAKNGRWIELENDNK